MKVYGDPFTRLYSLLRNLRLEYKEHNKNSQAVRYIECKEFEFRIVFSAAPLGDSYRTFLFKADYSEEQTVLFGEELLWYLISCGYMAYIREHPEGSNERIYTQLLVTKGWAEKIVRRRLEDWESRPDRKFMAKRTKLLVGTFSTPEIIHRFPGFFDFLS